MAASAASASWLEMVTVPSSTTSIIDVVGTPADMGGTPLGLPDVTDEDPSHYFGAEPSADNQNTTNTK